MSEDTAPNTPGQALQPETENASDKLGERLRRLRKEAGWTLQDLARRSGVSLSTLSKIENAQVAPTFDTLVKAAHGLGIGFETLLADSDSGGKADWRPTDRDPRAGRLQIFNSDVRVSCSRQRPAPQVHDSPHHGC